MRMRLYTRESYRELNDLDAEMIAGKTVLLVQTVSGKSNDFEIGDDTTEGHDPEH